MTANSAEELKALGNAAHQAQKYSQAIEYYTRAHQLAPDNPVYLSNRAASFLELGRYNESVSDCTFVINTLNNDDTTNKFTKEKDLSSGSSLLSKVYQRLARGQFFLGDSEAAQRTLLLLPSSSLDTRSKQLSEWLNASTSKQQLDNSAGTSTRVFSTLPLFRSAPLPTSEFFPIGHDAPQSILEKARKFDNDNNNTNNEQKKVKEEDEKEEAVESIDFKQYLSHSSEKTFRVLFGGVGDPRHVLATVHDVFKQTRDFQDDFQLEIHINDIMPEMLIRDIVLMIAVANMSKYEWEIIKSQQDEVALQHAALPYVLWLGINIPPAIYKIMLNQFSKLIELSRDVSKWNQDPMTSWIIMNEEGRKSLEKTLLVWSNCKTDVKKHSEKLVQCDEKARKSQQELLDSSTMNGKSASKAIEDQFTAMTEALPEEEIDRALSMLNKIGPDKIPKTLQAKRKFMLKILTETSKAMGGTLPLDVKPSYLKEWQFHKENQLILLPPLIHKPSDTLDKWKTNPSLLSRQASQNVPSWLEGWNWTEVGDVWSITSLIKSLSNKAETTLFHDSVYLLYQWSIALNTMKNERKLQLFVHFGDMHAIASQFSSSFSSPSTSSAPNPCFFDRISLNNVTDYTIILNGFLYFIPLLRSFNNDNSNNNNNQDMSELWTRILLATGYYTSLSHYLWSSMKIHGVDDLGSLFGVQFLSGELWAGEQRWTQSTLPLSFEKLKPMEELHEFLAALFLAIEYPSEKSYEKVAREYSPMTLKSFMLVIQRLLQVGYPAHWLSSFLEKLLNNQLSTSATPPATMFEPLPTTKSNKKLHFDTRPFTVDLLIALSLAINNGDLFKFGIQAQIPSANSLYYCSGTFTVNMMAMYSHNIAPCLAALVIHSFPSSVSSPSATAQSTFSYLRGRKQFMKAVFAMNGNAQLISLVNVDMKTDPPVVGLWLPPEIVQQGDGAVVMVVRTDIWTSFSNAFLISSMKQQQAQ